MPAVVEARMLRRSLLVLGLAALLDTAAEAQPGLQVRYEDEVLRVTLEGTYLGRYYQVWRGDQFAGEYQPLAAEYTLCTGDCSVGVLDAVPGRTYYYRFEVLRPQGGFDSFGPFPVTVPDIPLLTTVSPNPSNGRAQIRFSVPGSRRQEAPVQAEARVLDLQGRTVRRLYTGALARGVTTFDWDGGNDAGQPLGAGIYFVRLSTPLGASTTRIVRFR
jgi:hypothetical protein